MQTFNVVVGTDGLSEDGPILNPEDRVLHPLSLHIWDEGPGDVCRRCLCHLAKGVADMADRQELQSKDHSNEVVNSDSTSRPGQHSGHAATPPVTNGKRTHVFPDQEIPPEQSARQLIIFVRNPTVNIS